MTEEKKKKRKMQWRKQRRWDREIEKLKELGMLKDELDIVTSVAETEKKMPIETAVKLRFIEPINPEDYLKSAELRIKYMEDYALRETLTDMISAIRCALDGCCSDSN